MDSGLLDYGTVVDSSRAAGTEAALTVAGFVLLGRYLGLHSAPRRQ